MFDLTKLYSNGAGADGGNGSGGFGGGNLGMLQATGAPPIDRQAMLAGLMMSLGQAFANQGRMRPMQAISNAIGSVASAGGGDPARMAQMMQAGQQMREQQRRNQTREWLVRNADRLGIPADLVDKLNDAQMAEIFLRLVQPPNRAATAGGSGVAPVTGAPSGTTPIPQSKIPSTIPGGAAEVSSGTADPIARWWPMPVLEGFRNPTTGS